MSNRLTVADAGIETRCPPRREFGFTNPVLIDQEDG
jgi:hypothetical protein